MLEKATPSRSAENVTRKANKKAGKDGVQLPVNVGLQKRVEAEVGPISDLKDHQAFKVAIDKIRGNPQLRRTTTATTTSINCVIIINLIFYSAKLFTISHLQLTIYFPTISVRN